MSTSSQKKSKLSAYIGFSVKSRKIIYGYEGVCASRKRVFLILADEALGESSHKKLAAYAERSGVRMITLPAGIIASYCGAGNIKCIGLTDENLASAAEKEINNTIGGSN